MWVQNKYGQDGRVRHEKVISLSVLTCKMDEKLECLNYDPNKEEMDINIFLALSVSLAVIRILAVVIFALCILRKGKEEEDLEIDENYYYGDDGNMESIRDHRVVDNNDYYD